MRREGRRVEQIHCFPYKLLTTEQQEYSDNNGDKGTNKLILFGEDGAKREPPKSHAQHTRDKVRIFLKAIWSRVWSHSNRQIVFDPRVWLEVAALVTVIFYTRYAGQQRDAMNETLAEVKKQTGFASTSAQAATTAAKVAQDSILQSDKQFRQDQRPYIWIVNSTGMGEPQFLKNSKLPAVNPTGQILWPWHITNYGRSVAYGVTCRAFIKINKGPLMPNYKSELGNIGPVPPNVVVAAATSTKPGIPFDTFTHIETFADGRTMDNGAQITLVLRFNYTDAYGTKYKSGICLWKNPFNQGTSFCGGKDYIE
jgi:hypothetical protein